MSLYSLAAFVAVYALAVASPGPGVAAIIARALAHGTRGAPPFIAGIMVGDLVWLLLTVTGLAVLAQTMTLVFTIIRYAGALYLLFLAYRTWHSPVQALNLGAAPNLESALQSFLAALSLTLGNPKAVVFYLAVLPSLVNLETLSLIGILEIAAVIVLVLPLILGIYAAAAARAQRLFRSERALRRLNRVTATILACAGAAVALQ